MIRILIVLFLCSFELFGQALTAVDSKEFQASRYVGTDAYKNNYWVKDLALQKKGPEGDFVYNDFQLGQISSVDIINPLKLVVFYEDTNTVVLLDNKLSEIERVNFNNLPDFLNLSTATNAGSNRLWIFNVDTQQLELYNYRDKLKTTISQPFAGKLVSQASNFNYCYTLTEQKLRSFNSYGSLLSETVLEGFNKILLHDKLLIGLKNNQLFLLTENAIEPIKLPVSENTIKDLFLTKEFLYIYDGFYLHTYTLTLPKK
ncbi:hypothetical protein [Ulvibacter antarcticus]|nr:hypothetical protein [Ulvibacter antarcticus]